MTGSSSNNVQSKVFFKGNMMTGSLSNNVHSKVSFKGNMMTGSLICRVQSKIVKFLLKGSRVTGFITMFIVKYLSKAT
jgi:hypothetical protein